MSHEQPTIGQQVAELVENYCEAREQWNLSRREMSEYSGLAWKCMNEAKQALADGLDALTAKTS